MARDELGGQPQAPTLQVSGKSATPRQHDDVTICPPVEVQRAARSPPASDGFTVASLAGVSVGRSAPEVSVRDESVVVAVSVGWAASPSLEASSGVPPP